MTEDEKIVLLNPPKYKIYQTLQPEDLEIEVDLDIVKTKREIGRILQYEEQYKEIDGKKYRELSKEEKKEIDRKRSESTNVM